MATVRNQVKEHRWQCFIREQQASGQSVSLFCRERGLSSHQFFWWRRELARRGELSATPSTTSNDAFVAVRIPIYAPTVEVVHPTGCVIRIPAGVDTQVLRSVLAALSSKEV